jgi:hypothetical protein
VIFFGDISNTAQQIKIGDKAPWNMGGNGKRGFITL